jgi:hypothetical protein
MIVEHTPIFQEWIDACLARMQQGPFKAADIAMAARQAGAVTVFFRLADRLIQRERKAGNISMNADNKWKWNQKSI